MSNNNLRMGILFGFIGVIVIGLQPIVANSRPTVLDFYIFAAMTTIVEALIFLPLMLLERRKIRSDLEAEKITFEEMDSLLNGYKKNIPLLIFVGFAFGIGMILFFIGYQLSGTIAGSLAQKSTVFWAIIFGWLLLHEKISIKQIIFSFILFFGLILASTQGSFNLIELNIGILIILLLSCIWMFTHTISKPMIDRKEATPIQLVCLRNAIGGTILISTYFIFYPLENAKLLVVPEYIYWFLLMGAVYGVGLFCWYKTLAYLEVNKASLLMAPTPIMTAVFAVLILGEIFTIYHLVGTSLVIISIIIIVSPSKEKGKDNNDRKGK